jgi:hypothetical protein
VLFVNPFPERIAPDGQWRFWTDPDDAHSPISPPEKEARPINVPAPWQAQAAGLRFYRS